MQGRRVLVTGGSQGIGLAVARGFLAEGAIVTIVARATRSGSRGRPPSLPTSPAQGAVVLVDGEFLHRENWS